MHFRGCGGKGRNFRKKSIVAAPVSQPALRVRWGPFAKLIGAWHLARATRKSAITACPVWAVRPKSAKTGRERSRRWIPLDPITCDIVLPKICMRGNDLFANDLCQKKADESKGGRMPNLEFCAAMVWTWLLYPFCPALRQSQKRLPNQASE